MQKIFYNAKFYTLNDGEEVAEAMLVNDGIIVFAGKKDEVFSMKTEDTKLVDLKEKSVLPAFFDMNLSLFKIIENRIKNAKSEKYIENLSEFDENYDKFVNFKLYKNEFLKLQQECLENGVTTVCEVFVGAKEFTFWKKLSEQNLLKIDINCFVDMLGFKQVMDDNCRSFRKYKNHLKLGGYCLNLDGEIINKRAWLAKPYRHEAGYGGEPLVGFEQLSFLIKAALEEKKQLMVFASGDMAVEQFLTCLGEHSEGKDAESFCRPILNFASVISEKQIKKLKQFSVSLGFKISDITYGKTLIKIIGKHRANNIQPAKLAEKFGLNFMLCSSKDDINKADLLIDFASKRETLEGKVFGKNQRISANRAFASMVKDAAFCCFDETHKGSLENGKLSNFVVIDSFNLNSNLGFNILSTYIDGECQFKAK